MNPAYDRFENASPTSKRPSGCVLFIAAIAVIAVAIGVYGFVRDSSQQIEIRAAVTIFTPQRIGIDPESCSGDSLTVALASFNDPVKDVKLGTGDASRDDKENACRWTFTTTVPRSESFEASIPGTKLPTKRLDRISDRSFDDGDGEYVIWEIIWEP